MAKEDFYRNVRTTVGMLLPRENDHHYPAREEFEEILRRSARGWLSKDSVAGFERDDFQDLDTKTLETLDKDVSTFLEVASMVDEEGQATTDQVETAAPKFLQIAELVRHQTHDDWLGAARKLIDEAAEWAEAEGWPTRRHSWELNEPFLGTYELDRLIYGVMGSQMALVPVGRFMMKSQGSFDLAIMPAYESVSIRRLPSGRWMIGPLPGENGSLTWKPQHFVEVSRKLARMG
jgi:hypothetical protein